MHRIAPLLPALLLAATTSALAQDGPKVSVLRVAPPAKLLAGKKPAALLPTKSVAPGSRVTTGPNGRAALQISGGVLTLSGDAELFVHSTATGESADIARLALAKGALRVQVARDNRTPLDLRLNVGALRLRSLAADLWAAVENRGETVCLIAGEVEIAAEFGTEKLEAPGDCLFFSAQNRRLVLKPDGAETMARKLERTAFATDVAMGLPAAAVPSGPRTSAEGETGDSTPVAIRVAEPEPPENTFEIIAAPSPPPLPEPEPIQPGSPPPATAATAPSAPAAPAPVEPALALAMAVGDEPDPPPRQYAAPAPSPRAPEKPFAPPPKAAAPVRAAAPAASDPSIVDGWLIVLASPGSNEAASGYAAKLQQSGIQASVRAGGGKFRVVAGPYASRQEASAAKAQLQYQLKGNDFWLLAD